MAKIQTTLTHREINFSLSEFHGNYTADKPDSQYYTNTSTKLTFKLCIRKEPTPLRPQYYLMQRLASGSWVYLTSLYPRSNGTYVVEIQRNYFKVILATDKGGFSVFR
jgi:hypothetical protein